MYHYEDIEDHMRSLQPGRLTFDEYFNDDIIKSNNNTIDCEEPDSFIGAKAILEFSSHVRKYSGGKNGTCDTYKTSKQILEERCDGEEITEMLKDLNVFGRKKYTPKKPMKQKMPLIKKGEADRMPLLLDESFFKLKDRKTDSNTISRDGSYSKKEYTPREIYELKRKK